MSGRVVRIALAALAAPAGAAMLWGWSMTVAAVEPLLRGGVTERFVPIILFLAVLGAVPLALSLIWAFIAIRTGRRMKPAWFVVATPLLFIGGAAALVLFGERIP